MIKFANCIGTLSPAYGSLKDSAVISYQEHSFSENISYLMAGSVDAALISATDFALHGGCIGTNYGIIHTQKNAFALYVKGALQNLQTVYLQDAGEVIWLLLKILFAEHWKIAPRLLRIIRPFQLTNLKENEGVFKVKGLDCEDLEIIDPIETWQKLTGLPFVTAIWTIANANIRKEVESVLKDNFDKNFGGHYLDTKSIASLNKFYELSDEYDLLPATSYARTVKNRSVETVEDLLQRVLLGKRLSINNAVRIVHESKLQDLILIADMLRKRLFAQNTSKVVLQLKPKNYADFKFQVAKLQTMDLHGVSAILLYPFSYESVGVELYEQVIKEVKASSQLELIGLGIPTLYRLYEDKNTSFDKVAERLISAGLDGVSAWGGEMLVEYKKRAKSDQNYVPDWLRVVKWWHRYGAKTMCCMRLSRKDTWEERLMHMHKLRLHQDQNVGFVQFDILPDKDIDVESRLKAVAIARLFLDNITSICEVGVCSEDPVSAVCISCGANLLQQEITLIG